MPVAFPGAEGYGRNAVGGRGGTLYIVSNLNDSGAGSFRAACEASGARIVVFTTGGTITLDSELIISNPNITIAGQTAPGGGITLKANPSYSSVLFNIDASDVIVRYLRVRRGEHTASGSSGDGVLIGDNLGVSDVILDHCSLSWGVDECLSVSTDASNITIQWCIVSEGLHDSTHSGGPHSKGTLVTGTVTNLSMHHNLFAHNDERDPRLDGGGGIYDLVNNVIYNPARPSAGGWAACHISDDGDLNCVGNFCKAGLDTIDPSYYISGGGTFSIYVQGNICPDRPTDSGDEDLIIRTAQRDRVTGTRFSAPQVNTQSPTGAYDIVLAQTGASRSIDPDGTWRSNRDSVDDRVVADVKAGTGNIIDNQDDVGGWPSLAAGTAPTDTDSDGMPDEWEDLHGLDKNSATDQNTTSNNGWTNIENFINGIPLLEHGGPSLI